jgi:hypothetical protein
MRTTSARCREGKVDELSREEDEEEEEEEEDEAEGAA